MIDHVANRQKLLDALREELVGPAPAGEALDCSGDITIEQPEKGFNPWRQQTTGDEILVSGAPIQRYGVGVLYPAVDIQPETQIGLDVATVSLAAGVEASDANESLPIGDEATKQLGAIADHINHNSELETDDFDLSLVNAYHASSIGVSFLAAIPDGCSLVVEVPAIHPRKGYRVNGRYRRKLAKVKNSEGKYSEREWWLRSPIRLHARFDAESLKTTTARKVIPRLREEENLEHLSLEVEVFSRPHDPGNGEQLITVCLVNRSRSDESGQPDERALFQVFFEVRIECPDGNAYILPYPEAPIEALDAEEKSLALLYRSYRSFATGHGCSADWGQPDGAGRVHWVSAECMPTVQVPGMTPDITREDGTPIKVSMGALAQLSLGDEGFAALEEVISQYEIWIKKQRAIIATLDPKFRTTAHEHMVECERCLSRMRQGLDYLRTDEQVRFAFGLANKAILQQQICGSLQPRDVHLGKDGRFEFGLPYPNPENHPTPAGRGTWRAFQVAFLLMSLRSVAEGDIPEREEVDLIWFPTGGGKTEAYLGLAAFAMFIRRLRNPHDTGVNVLMRYTLRLLTAQQFQRAAGLITAMEHLRLTYKTQFGNEAFSIGIWLGDSTTPNTRQRAVELLNELNKGANGARNKFLITRCPWCGAQLGPINDRNRRLKNRVLGYERVGDTVQFRCSDKECDFSRRLPIYVIDEDIYEHRPSVVIGTADKFAMLAWEPKARSLFGWDKAGNRIASPPGLIIQDELHLIAGPLGSMVGLYEVLIEELCTDHRDKTPVRPKIVCSTATIRRYKDQIRALYARNRVGLFPPPGIDAADSFFARQDTAETGQLRPSRLYVGVHAPGLGSLQTSQVRTFSALIQAPKALVEEAQDPWWTSLVFFNSLRELGGALSLFHADIPDYTGTLLARQGKTLKDARRLDNVMELTSRLDSEEIPQVLEALGVKAGSKNPRPVDVCLASSIIEVGIDVDRLSLMAIVGQPKSTSQYIQVSGRVGRRLTINKDDPNRNDFRPGLVVVIYAATKPRDRSHFERFRSYHERLYAQVEPTSVTPFSPPALERALHAVMVAYARQVGAEAEIERPTPVPRAMLAKLRQLILDRVSTVDPNAKGDVERIFDKRMREWERTARDYTGALKWRANPQQNVDPPLLHPAGAYMQEDWRHITWSTPQSMRNVDSECKLQIAAARQAEDQNG